MATKTTEKKSRYRMILMNRAKKRPSAFASLHPEIVSSLTELRNSFAHAAADTFWISYTNDLTEALVKQMSASQKSMGWGLFRLSRLSFAELLSLWTVGSFQRMNLWRNLVSSLIEASP